MSSDLILQALIGVYITTHMSATSWIMANIYRLRQEMSADYAELHTKDEMHDTRLRSIEADLNVRSDVIVRSEARLDSLERRLARMESP